MIKLISLLLLFQIPCFSQYNPDYLNYMCDETEKPFFRVLPNGDGTETVLPGRRYSHYFKFEVPNKSGKKRIFIIGESSAVLLYNNRSENFFDRNFLKKNEIFNFGMAAYDAPRLLEVFREALEFKPDAIIVMAGNNGGFFYSCPGPADALRRASLSLKKKYLAWFGKEKEALAEYGVGTQKQFFLEMARRARAKQVKLFFAVLPVNHFFPPSGTAPETPGFLRAYKSYSDGKYEESAALFRELLAKGKNEPFANYYAGLSFYALKKYGEAASYLKAAVRYDPRLDRTSDLTGKMIRELASSEGAGLVDLESFFLSLSPNGVIEEKYFSDGVHWLRKYNGMAQAFIFKDLDPEAAPVPAPAGDSEEDRNNFLRYAVSYAHNERTGINERALYMIGRFLDASGVKPGEMTRERVRGFLQNNMWLNLTDTLDMWWCSFSFHLGETARRRGKDSAAQEIFEKAEKACGLSEDFCGPLALALKDSGSENKIRGLAEKCAGKAAERLAVYAQVWDIQTLKRPAKKPVPAELGVFSALESKKYSDAGVEALLAGDAEKAVRLFEKAVKANPGNFEAYISLCGASSRTGSYDKALQACSRAVEIAGENPLNHPADKKAVLLREALLERARIHENAGKKELAEKDRLAAEKAGPAAKRTTK